MAKHNENNRRRTASWGLAALMSLICLYVTAAPRQTVLHRDSTQNRAVVSPLQPAPHELPDIRHRMVTSPQPVEIRQQGRSLCVTSRYNQLLPIYSASGSLYSSFRLSKGTNWLNGLPRGSYIINNRKFTIN